MKTKKIGKEGVDSFYDKDEDILYIHFKENQYTYSFEARGMIFDFNKSDELIAIEIPHAKSFFRTHKKFMLNLFCACILIEIKKNNILFTSQIKSKEGTKRKQKTVKENFINYDSIPSQKVEFCFTPA